MRLKDETVLFSELRHGRRYCLSPYLLETIESADALWRAYGADELVITSGVEIDAWHTRASEHWQGNALDGRIRNLPGVTVHRRADGTYYHKDRDGRLPDLRADMMARWGPDYRVIIEGHHMHWDNKPERIYRPVRR
ncbi:MAG: hypothetical protein OEQ74_03305 [Gammaproteobacteria bacterium]|nr:hypothetical protein [Gammaproteobacteria bacterium]